MNIRMHLSDVLAYYANNQSWVNGQGNTVNECLKNLTEQFPDLKQLIEVARLGNRIDIFLNQENNAVEDFSKPVKIGDELNIQLLVG